MAKNKILLVTAKSAFDSVKKYSGVSKTPAQIHVSDVDVAALISQESLIKELSEKNLDDISIILLPGNIQWDADVIGKEIGIPCFKGPVNAANLPILLDEINDIDLSTTKPADAVMKEKIKQRIKGELGEMKKYRYKFGNENPYIHILAEVENAPKLSESELKKRARYYENSGADMIDIGMIASGGNEDKIPEIVGTIKEVTDLPISIDTLDEAEILSAVESGVDLVLSLDETNLEIASSINASVVVIPRNSRGKIPKEVNERVTLLEDLIGKVSDSNKSLKDKIIADPILDPINFGFTQSLASYYGFRRRNPKMPMLMGIGNVTELLDADSVGANALLAGIASELNIDIIFTVEASAKNRGSVRELDVARKMMYLAKKHRQLPKDLGIDLLILKDKKWIEDIIDPKIKDIDFVKVKKTKIRELERGMFRIYLEDGEIKAVYYDNKNPKIGFRGKDAKDMYKTIVHRIKISTEHAAYLGKELGKAETALKLGKNYIQDTELF